MRRALVLTMATALLVPSGTVAQDTPLDQISAWSDALQASDLQDAMTALGDDPADPGRRLRVTAAVAADKEALLAINPDPCWQDSYLDHWDALTLNDAAMALMDEGEVAAATVLLTLSTERSAAFGDTTRLDDCFGG
jgi:hypothetical protein